MMREFVLHALWIKCRLRASDLGGGQVVGKPQRDTRTERATRELCSIEALL
jgi:hypothetical protein